VDEEPDGVWFVDLSPLHDPAVVAPTIALVLAGREEIDGALADKRLLVILDNFEQVLPAAVDVAALLRDGPGLRVLGTSRQALHLEGEHEYPVPPLADADAVTLFVERARAVVPSFEPDTNVSEIC